MRLPFFQKKQQNKDFFIALILSPSEVRSILFEKDGENLLILGTHKQDFPETLDTLSSERLIELSDVVISEVETRLPGGAELSKTIFAVPDRWVVDGKIIKDHLSKLKSLCDALHLTPVGFIVSIEAIIAYLHKKAGVPVTAIIVEIGKMHVTMSLVKNGAILKTSESEIIETPVVTVEKLLSTQEELEVLPAKIILLNFEHAKKTQQAFLSHTWSKSLQFLHIPSVEVLDPEVEAQAVISGVAAQMGFSTLSAVNIDTIEKKEEPVEITEAQQEDTQESKSKREELKEEPEVLEGEKKAEAAFNGESIGFKKDVDVLKDIKKEEEDATENLAPIPEKAIEQEEVVHVPQPEQPVLAEDKSTVMPSIPMPHMPHMSFSVPNIKSPLKGRAIFLYPLLAVLIFIALTVGYYYFFEKAEVTIYLDKKGVNKELAVSFSTDDPTSAADSVVHIDTTSIQVNGKEDNSATGKKETGEKAKGSVTLYNKTDSPHTFTKGTTVIGPNNLEFNLVDDVKVASTSSFSTSFSSTDAKVEADNFGKEYNLPSASNFQVKGQSTSDYFAKNNSAFSGGTKKEITVVSSDDIASLQKKILSSLNKKAMEDAVGKIGAESQVLNTPLDYSFDEKDFSKKAGDAADSVSLTATITYKLGTYKKSDLIALAKDITGKDAPSDYTYSGEDSEIQVKDVKNDEGDISGKINFSSVFLPKISQDSMSSKIAGKSSDKADQLIQTPGISDDKIVFVRSLPFFPKILPFNKKNIVITVESN